MIVLLWSEWKIPSPQLLWNHMKKKRTFSSVFRWHGQKIAAIGFIFANFLCFRWFKLVTKKIVEDFIDRWRNRECMFPKLLYCHWIKNIMVLTGFKINCLLNAHFRRLAPLVLIGPPISQCADLVKLNKPYFTLAVIQVAIFSTFRMPAQIFAGLKPRWLMELYHCMGNCKLHYMKSPYLNRSLFVTWFNFRLYISELCT